MDGAPIPCPRCNKYDKTGWLSTTNEWEFECERCDIRYNKKGEILQK